MARIAEQALRLWQGGSGTTVDIANLELLGSMDLARTLSIPYLALSALHVLAAAVAGTFKSRAALHLENLLLRHQLGVLQRSGEAAETDATRSAPLGLALRDLDRLAIGAGHRQTAYRDRLAPKGFCLFWTRKIRRGQPGRPTVATDVRELSED
jgi:hypothetical protein